jgi:hypothetical protein
VGPVWGGITDHSTAGSFSWSQSGLYYATKVIDDQHQNPGSGWNGDSVQIMFSDAACQGFAGWGGYPQGGLTTPRDLTDSMDVILYNSTAISPSGTSSRSCRRPPSALATRSVPLQPTLARRVLRRSSSTTSAPLASGRRPERRTVQVMFTNAERIGRAQTGTAAGMILYNHGLAEPGDLVLHHESHPCPPDDFCTEMVAIRDEGSKTTVYELVFSALTLGVDQFSSGYQFGLGICVNDGDSEQIGGGNGAGQGGWSGWAPYGIVHDGKRAENNGLAI